MMNDRGFVLTLVIAFMLLLVLGGVSTAVLTRSNMQVVGNLRTSTAALFTAEAGVTEMLLRLEMPKPTTVTVNGRTFDASIVPNAVNPAWTGRILLGSFDPVPSGSVFTTPTIQSSGSQLLYSTTSAGAQTLTVSCFPDGAGGIKKIGGKNVVRIVSTGRVGRSSRQITVLAMAGGSGGYYVIGDVCKALSASGSSSLNVPGKLQVNSPCSDAVTTSGSASITSSKSIDIVGSYQGSGYSPLPNTGAPAIPDPLASLPAPNYADYAVRNGTPASPSTLNLSSPATLSPGVYYGGISISANVTLLPGVYIMGGGGFKVSGGNTVTGSGIMIYNSESLPGKGDFGSLTNSSSVMNVSAPGSGDYRGILFFQDRNNTKKSVFSGGAGGTIDGLFYFPNALIELSGGSGGPLKSEFIVHSMKLTGSASFAPPTAPLFGGGYQQVAWQDY